MFGWIFLTLLLMIFLALMYSDIIQYNVDSISLVLSLGFLFIFSALNTMHISCLFLAQHFYFLALDHFLYFICDSI
jgi:hypothetical protein